MDNRILRIRELKDWFQNEYIFRLEHIRRCRFLGITPDETEQHLQEEAYVKEQELRKLQGKSPLGKIKNKISI